MTWALFRHDDAHKAVKAHVHLELLKGVAVAAEVTDARTDEATHLAGRLEAGRLYVLDRGYFRYALYEAIAAVLDWRKQRRMWREILSEQGLDIPSDC